MCVRPGVYPRVKNLKGASGAYPRVGTWKVLQSGRLRPHTQSLDNAGKAYQEQMLYLIMRILKLQTKKVYNIGTRREREKWQKKVFVNDNPLKTDLKSWQIKFWETFFGNFLGTFWELFGNFLGTFWGLFGNFLGTFWEILGTFGELFGNFLGTFLIIRICTSWQKLR